MKKKLTLTIEEETITAAKREAKRRGISVSHMFEQAIGSSSSGEIENESQRAAKRLLNKLRKAESSADKNDKKLLQNHVKRKFT